MANPLQVGSFLSGANAAFLEELLERYLTNPDMVVPEWRRFFAGVGEEPRPSRKKGHVPGSLNLPFAALMDPGDHFTLRPAAEIEAAFAGAGVDAGGKVVATCGSGVTAAVLALGLYLIGNAEGAVYDGSWSEWGNRDDTPVEP